MPVLIQPAGNHALIKHVHKVPTVDDNVFLRGLIGEMMCHGAFVNASSDDESAASSLISGRCR